MAQDFGPDRAPALAGPFGLFLTLFLIVVVIFLIRGMNKHIRRLNTRLQTEADAAHRDAGDDEAGPSAAK